MKARWIAAAALGCAAACDGSSPPETPDSGRPPQLVTLVDHYLWAETATAADPLASHRPHPVSCRPGGWGVEGAILEADTGRCNYLSVAQPALHAIEEGKPLKITLWHLVLTSSVPAQAHVAVLADGRPLWEMTIPVPSKEEIYEPMIAAPFGAPAGAPLVFHLHNHGANSWRLLDVQSEQP